MRRYVLIGLVATGLVLAGCGESEPTGYNAEVEQTFVSTCTDRGDDLADVCQCAYDSFEREIPFDRFQRIDERLADNPDASLPDDFLDLYTDCVLQQGGGSAGTTPTLPTTTTVPGTATTLPGGVTPTTPTTPTTVVP